MSKKYSWIYILTTKNHKLLYIGVTSNLENRMYQHINKLIKGYSSKYNVNKLVYYELFEDIRSAIAREKQLKNWHRVWKDNLISSKNPDWVALCDIDGRITDFRMIAELI